MPGSEAQNLLNLDRVYPRRQTRVNVEHLPGAPHTGIRMPMLEGTETVLVVDDETFMLSLAESMLVRNGYSVLTAPVGKKCSTCLSYGRT